LGLRQAASYRPGAVAPLQEGVERFFITDINNPAEAAATGGPRQFQDGPARGSGASFPSIAGMLPVRISLPETGRSYVFGRALTPEGQVVSVTITTVPRGARPYGLGALGVAAGLVAFLIARYAMRRLPRWWTAVALLALAAVAVGVFRDSALGLTISLSALVGAALAVGLRALRNRNRPEPAGGEAP
jgi:hypothetical protein